MCASLSTTMFSLNHQNFEAAKTQAKQGLKAFDQLNANLFAPVAPQKPALTVNEALRRIQIFRGFSGGLATSTPCSNRIQNLERTGSFFSGSHQGFCTSVWRTPWPDATLY